MTGVVTNVVAVEYLNTLPFIRGMEGLEDPSWFHLIRAHPSDCARILQEGTAHVGLIPVAAIPDMGEVELFSPYCIGAEGTVDTVGICSERPLEELTGMYLDYQSRTSVALCKLLISEYWQLGDINWIDANPGYESEIGGEAGGLIIGDRVFEMKQKYTYFYDLGAAWHSWTGLPFAFAVWLARPKVSKRIRSRLTKAFRRGMKSIPDLKREYASRIPDQLNYFEESISYRFDAEKQQAVALFLEKIGHPQTADKIFPSQRQEIEG